MLIGLKKNISEGLCLAHGMKKALCFYMFISHTSKMLLLTGRICVKRIVTSKVVYVNI